MEDVNLNFDFNESNRFELWSNFIIKNKVQTLVEIGVYRGEFAEFILKKCNDIDNYIMISVYY